MPPADRAPKSSSIPEVPPPPGAIFSLRLPRPWSKVYGSIDLDVVLSGLRNVDRVRAYLDGEPMGERLTFLGRNRYTQLLDTTHFIDGEHTLAVAALDARGDVLSSCFAPLVFRNAATVEIATIRPNEAGNGFVIRFAVNSLRVELTPSLLTCVRVGDTHFEDLSLRLAYDGEERTGLPLALLHADLPGGELVGDAEHRLRLSVLDNQGDVVAWTERIYRAQ